MAGSKTKILLILIVSLLILLPTLSFSEDKEMTKEEYLEEIKKVKELINEYPENPVLHNRLGFYYFKTDDYDRAKKEYSAAIKYDEDYSTPYNNLGIIALKNAKYDEAEEYFSGAIERDPKYAKAVYNLGVTYFRQKRYIKAVRYYLKAKKVDKEYVNKREDREKGEKELREALKKDPDNKVLQYLLKKSNEKKKK